MKQRDLKTLDIDLNKLRTCLCREFCEGVGVTLAENARVEQPQCSRTRAAASSVTCMVSQQRNSTPRFPDECVLPVRERDANAPVVHTEIKQITPSPLCLPFNNRGSFSLILYLSLSLSPAASIFLTFFALDYVVNG
jgi:hypothetical protein